MQRLSIVQLFAVAGHAFCIDYATESGMRPWVDVDTPKKEYTYKNSRGKVWNLVMSDEFNTPGRKFKPGDDHMWTSIEKPDGVNDALNYYSHNMSTTVCEKDLCYFQIKIADDVTKLSVWNNYQAKPGYRISTFYYRSGMVQSWNKFCYQGGMLEVRAKLPGVTDKDSGNPDLKNGKRQRVKALDYYPTWPGIWMMGNLGRAIFSASTHRVWPFSYDECNEVAFNSSNQRISACDKNPGYGLNPKQGRGAPEIDLIEGAGDYISTSIQVGPGMPKNYRRFDDGNDCAYTASCGILGANVVGVPTSVYKQRGHGSWYQGLKYAANNNCDTSSARKQSYSEIASSLQAGLTANKCTNQICPASFDVNSDISLMNPNGNDHWGINTNGTCFPVMNAYSGSYLCSPGNKFEYCEKDDVPESNVTIKFGYQMDAISANIPMQLQAYTEFLVYQVEWVFGDDGYVRWILSGQTVYEIPSKSMHDVPQDARKTNPRKIMVEEPLYLIMNVALSSSWGVTPPNAGKSRCKGDGSDSKANKICDSFPLTMQVDYIRLYQDTSKNSKMTVTCDPSTHPTKKWIEGHIDEYQDADNMWVPVRGKGICSSNDDCTVAKNISSVRSGYCYKKRCKCSSASWAGPRCSSTLSGSQSDGKGVSMSDSFGPPIQVELMVAAVILVATVLSLYQSAKATKKLELDMEKRRKIVNDAAGAQNASKGASLSHGNYDTNFI